MMFKYKESLILMVCVQDLLAVLVGLHHLMFNCKEISVDVEIHLVLTLLNYFRV